MKGKHLKPYYDKYYYIRRPEQKEVVKEKKIVLISNFWSHWLVVLKVYSCLCTQESLLEGLGKGWKGSNGYFLIVFYQKLFKFTLH